VLHFKGKITKNKKPEYKSQKWLKERKHVPEKDFAARGYSCIHGSMLHELRDCRIRRWI